jgi:hypothetical protein
MPSFPRTRYPVATRPTTAKKIQFHFWDLGLLPGVVTREPVWTVSAEAACNEVDGVVEPVANAILEAVAAEVAVVLVAVVLAAFNSIFELPRITCSKYG